MSAEVDVLVARLDLPAAELAALLPLLDEGERARAQRYGREILRSRFIAGRAFLRMALAVRLDTDPRRLRFTYGPRGKPALDGPLRFNLSHTDDVALLALSERGEIGADVERVRPGMDHVALAQRVFSARETAWLVAHSEAERPKAFFDCWTAKEAYVKARGDGLAFPLQAFHALPGQFAVYDDRRESERWSVLPAPLAGDLSAAVAAEGDGWRPTLREWRWGEGEGP